MRTKAKLASESERLQFALGEIDILNKQLQREKLSFENVYVCKIFKPDNNQWPYFVSCFVCL